MSNSKLKRKISIAKDGKLYAINVYTRRGVLVEDQYLYCSKKELELIAEKIKEILEKEL